jgi:adenylate kinase
LDQVLDVAGVRLDAVFNLEVDDAIIEDRMSGRRSCPTCGAVYHIRNLKPKREGFCDHDGTALVLRPDDELEVVRQRLVAYHQQTRPLIDYYKGRGILYQIDANDGVDVVDIQLQKIIDSLAIDSLAKAGKGAVDQADGKAVV